MPYTVKTITTWADDETSDDDKKMHIKNLKNLRQHFGLDKLEEFRNSLKTSGDILARGVVLAVDELSITTVVIFKDIQAQKNFSENAIVQNHLEKMREFGFKIVSQVI
jgi:hypothetical protein